MLEDTVLIDEKRDDDEATSFNFANRVREKESRRTGGESSSDRRTSGVVNNEEEDGIVGDVDHIAG